MNAAMKQQLMALAGMKDVGEFDAFMAEMLPQAEKEAREATQNTKANIVSAFFSDITSRRYQLAIPDLLQKIQSLPQ